MKVITTTHTNQDDFCLDYFEIELTDDEGNSIDSVVFSHSADCPEDATMERDFKDVRKIEDLIKKAYYAGKDGEDFTTSSKEIEECQEL